MKKTTILVDMDEVVTSLEKELLKRWRERYPDRQYIPLEQRTTWKMEEQYETFCPTAKTDSKEILAEKGFYRCLEPVPGAIPALKEMSGLYQVFFCTSPLTQYQNCVVEKYEWVEEHFGFDWTKKMILTKDKTLISGDFLIDDAPLIGGVQKPNWEHVLYELPNNRDVKGKRRITWETWKSFDFEGKYRRSRIDPISYLDCT